MMNKEEVRALGERVEDLEEKFAKYIGTDYAIATASGASAMNIIFSCFKGTCALSPYVCSIVPNTVSKYMKVRFVDVDKYYTVKKCKANVILAVHLYGQMCDLNSFKKSIVIEDCAHALGSEYRRKKAGSLGDVGFFSLRKNLAVGTGGMITTNNEKLARKFFNLRDKLERKNAKSLISFLGKINIYLNSKNIHNFTLYRLYRWDKLRGIKKYNKDSLTNVEASIAIAQLKKLDKFLKIIEKNVNYLNRNLKNIVKIPEVRKNTKHAFTRYGIEFHEDKDLNKICSILDSNGFDTGMIYNKEFQKNIKRFKGKYPVCKRLSKRLLPVTIPPTFKKSDLDALINLIKGFV